MNKVDRAAWLAERNLGIGGSECAAALGVDPHLTSRELWERKLGNLPEIEDNERMAAGRHIEPAIATWASEKYGLQLYQRHQSLVHPKYPFMRANVDRLVRGIKRGVEIKNVDRLIVRMSGEWGEDGSDLVPERFFLQCHHYMAVIGYPEWDLIACIGGNELRRYHIERDPEIIELIVEHEHDFWQHVEQENPPEFDYDNASTLPLLKKLYPGTGGGIVALPDEAVHWHFTMQGAKKKQDSYEAIVDGCKAHLLELMADAAIGKLNIGGEYRRKVIERKAYSVEATQYVDFRFSKAKGASNDE
ncbi:lambda-exonuclease family protein [Caballeronia sp. LZ035]|uniref:YqaJ viral recombinase family nuclease n=1 Tax=Caballeronia sp. LZ035 TaxID=3038568 RepID=UPI002858AF8C|nr:YqaJ viral recombinase family protein [Caballeronia sp. LZ035]MDR5757874.1 YqaJ viral recombinase family protein [Caballeronia sp. LZ035]